VNALLRAWAQAVNQASIAARLLREPPLQGVAVGGFRVLDAELEAGKLHDVVGIGQRRERQGAVAQPVEQAAELSFVALRRPHAADVVHARREHPVLAAKGLRLAARHGVLLEHEHALAALAQRRRGREAADAGADDNRVPHAHPL
jgi:hypothetical protein